MEDRIESLERRLAEMENRVDSIERRSRRRLAAAALATGLAIVWSAAPEARAQFGLTLTGLNARLMAVEAKTAPIAVQGTDLTISGMDVHIVDGSGRTQSGTGLGNLTVGYNAPREDGTDARTGSHNLIIGDQNNFKSSGGLVAGESNEIDGVYATIGGGLHNTASGSFTSVGGGVFNTADGDYSSVCGGRFNSASGSFASVTGGRSNTASGVDSSVSGGFMRSAPDQSGWVAGGLSQPN